MAMVDPENDSITRFVVMHYRYDPDRHERRHVVVAAYDNEDEFDGAFAALAAHIRQARAAGEDIDPREHATGQVLEPGHHVKARNGRLVHRAIEHGVTPPEFARDDLPEGMDVVQFRLDG